MSWFDGFVIVIVEVWCLCGVDVCDVVVVCVDMMCCLVVVFDVCGDVIGNSVLWMDVRASDEATACVEMEDDVFCVNCVGVGLVSVEWMVFKVLWLK